MLMPGRAWYSSAGTRERIWFIEAPLRDIGGQSPPTPRGAKSIGFVEPGITPLHAASPAQPGIQPRPRSYGSCTPPRVPSRLCAGRCSAPSGPCRPTAIARSAAEKEKASEEAARQVGILAAFDVTRTARRMPCGPLRGFCPRFTPTTKSAHRLSTFLSSRQILVSPRCQAVLRSIGPRLSHAAITASSLPPAYYRGPLRRIRSLCTDSCPRRRIYCLIDLLPKVLLALRHQPKRRKAHVAGLGEVPDLAAAEADPLARAAV